MALLLKYLCSNCKNGEKYRMQFLLSFFYPNLVAMTLKNFVVLILSISMSIHFPKSSSNRYIWWNIDILLEKYEFYPLDEMNPQRNNSKTKYTYGFFPFFISCDFLKLIGEKLSHTKWNPKTIFSYSKNSTKVYDRYLFF